MGERDRPGMKSDTVPGGIQQQPAAVLSIPYDWAAMACQLGPQLVLPAGHRPEFDKRDFAESADHPGGADRRQKSGRRVLNSSRGPRSCRLTPEHGPLLAIIPDDPVLPGKPFSDDGRKPSLDNRQILLFYSPVAKLGCEAGRCRPGLCKHDHARDRLIKAAHNPDKGTLSQVLHQPDKQAVFPVSSVGRRQAGRLVEYNDLIIFKKDLDPFVFPP